MLLSRENFLVLGLQPDKGDNADDIEDGCDSTNYLNNGVYVGISGWSGHDLPNVKDEPRRRLARAVRQHGS